MERVKRRWWTWAVSLIAGAVIFGAVVSGLFQLAVLALPSYREDLSAWVTEVADRPVQIGGVQLVWRGVYPRLDLTDITLFSEAGEEALSVDRLGLGFSLLRLLRGDYFPSRIELSGLAVAVEIDSEGQIEIAGFTADAVTPHSGPRENWARDLTRFRRIRIENCDVLLRDARLDTAPLRFHTRRLDLRSGDEGFDLDGQLQLPATQGGSLQLSAEMRGALLQPRSWNGDFRIGASGLQPQGWLSAVLLPGAQIGAENLNLQINGDFASGRLRQAGIEVAADALVVARGGSSSGAQQARLAATVRGIENGWQVDVQEFRFDDEELLRAHAVISDGSHGTALDLDADLLRFTPLAPWFAVWREAPAWAQWAARAGGSLEGLVLRLRPQADALQYSLRARAQQVSLRADELFGFAQLSGELSANEHGGRLTLQQVPLQLQLPRAFESAVEFDQLSAQLQWQRLADGWRLQAPEFAWQLRSLAGQGKVELQFPDAADAGPQIDLSATLTAGDVNDAKPYMPRRWPASLHDWLQRGVVKGRVPRGTLLIRGPLRDFPYHQRTTGRWQLDLDAVGGTLAYGPGWPEITDLAAQLQFSGNSLDIHAQSGITLGNRLNRGRARFADFSDALLQVDAEVEGEMTTLYDFLRASPLHQRLSGLVDHTRAAGPAQVGLKLELPLHHLEQTRVDGNVRVDNVQLFYGALDLPVSGISGAVAFTEHGVTADALTARFGDLPLTARIEARDGTRGVLVADFAFAPRADGVGASQFIPAFVRSALSGSSQWRAELPFTDGASALQLRSELLGTTVALPPPLAKSATVTVPLRVSIGADAQAPLRVRVAYGQRMGLDLGMAPVDGVMHATALHARLGGRLLTPAKPDRFVLDGYLETLDLNVLVGMMSGDGSRDHGFRLDSADLNVDHLRWNNFTSAATRVQYAPTEQGWRAQLSGDGAQGSIDWTRADGGRVGARLQHLALQVIPAEAAAVPAESAVAAPAPAPVVADEVQRPPLDPTRLPLLDLSCTQLRVGDQDLGQLRLRTARIPGGQRLEQMTLANGPLQLKAGGQWRRAEERSNAALRFDLSTGDVGALLKAFAYAPNLEGENSHFSGELEWPLSASGLRWENAKGHIAADVSDGQLRAVQPGVGRVLGLVNFYAIPRRLMLNFRDVVGQGLSFDHIKGNFQLGEGVATTSDLSIAAPSLRMEVRGRVGLIARDYDQRITVYPDVSAGVTLGAALLGGPAVGALVLLAQELLDKPLDQATQLSYRVTGSWDNPKVDRVDGSNANP